MQRAERAIPDEGKLGSCGWPPEHLTLLALKFQSKATNFSFFLKEKAKPKGTSNTSLPKTLCTISHAFFLLCLQETYQLGTEGWG